MCVLKMQDAVPCTYIVGHALFLPEWQPVPCPYTCCVPGCDSNPGAMVAREDFQLHGNPMARLSFVPLVIVQDVMAESGALTPAVDAG